MNPTIVVNAYNRPAALKRLLTSLLKATYPVEHQTRLVISIDRGSGAGHDSVIEMAGAFQWPFGPLEVIAQSEHLGLVPHFFFCCGLTQRYDEIIYLEDDLIVSPAFYTYTMQALDFFRSDARIFSISLYALWFNGYTQQPFVPLADGTDVFFLQMPYTQGQAFTRLQWQAFADWFAAADRHLLPTDHLHDSFFHFGPDEWFPVMAKFVVEMGRYVVYPRLSLTSGAGDAGTHFRQTSVFFQTPLQGPKQNYLFPACNESTAIYDPFFEILPGCLNQLTHTLAGFNYDVDLYATKARRHLHAEYVLTSRRCRVAALSFGKTMWPMEANVIENVSGAQIFLCRTDSLRSDGWSNLLTRKSNHDFFTRHRHASRKIQLAFALLDFLDTLQNWFHQP